MMRNRSMLIIGATLIAMLAILMTAATPALATTVLVSTTGTLNAGASTDYNVGILAGSSVTVKVNCPSGSQFIPNVTVYRPGNILLTSFNAVAGAGNCGNGTFKGAASTFTVPVTGTYRINVLNAAGSVGNYAIKVTCNTCGDGRINAGHGDTYVALYPEKINGKHTLEVYCINKQNGQFGGRLLASDFDDFPKQPEVNTLVKTFDKCVVPVRVYLLTSGEYQVNIGPDGDGKTGVTVFTGLPPSNVYNYNLP